MENGKIERADPGGHDVESGDKCRFSPPVVMKVYPFKLRDAGSTAKLIAKELASKSD